jgi:glutamine synthetase
MASTELGDEDVRPRADTIVEALVAAEVALVALTYTDNGGIARVKGVPTGRFADAAVWGVGMSPVFDAFVLDDSITASPSAGGPVGDLRLVPDLDQLVVLATQPGWAWAPVDRWRQSGERHPQCQRELVRRMERALAEHGLEARMAFEIEWMLSDGGGDDFVAATSGPAYGLTRTIELSDYCAELVRALEAHGIPVEQLHPEYSSGQFEVSVAATDPLGAADRNVLTRQIVKAVSARHGLRATLAPSVVPGGVGNGMHLHLSLWRDGHNESTGGSGPLGLSATAEAFYTGLLDALPELLAVTAPSVASYLRLQPQRWAGPYRCWGLENREAALRLITGPAGREDRAANAEVKVVDAAASPYLAVAGVLAAGLAGLDAGGTLPPPVDVDPAVLDAADAEQASGRAVERLPATLGAAVDRFEASEVLRAAFGEQLHETIVAVRRAECALFAGATDDEIVAATRWRH